MKIADREMEVLLRQLAHSASGVIAPLGNPISVQMLEGQKISLVAAVYEGGNYIPHSVRTCVHKAENRRDGGAFLQIDEDQHSVSLHYCEVLDVATQRHFCSLLENFSQEAEEWRERLDERDRDDLIHVRAK